MPGYELPVGGPGRPDREFLNETRTPAKERARLKRIHGEFSRAFRALYSHRPGGHGLRLRTFQGNPSLLSARPRHRRRVGASRVCHADRRRAGDHGSSHHTHPAMKRVLENTNPAAAIQYFGDLDVPGIRIPVELSRLLERQGLTKVRPAERWYSLLLDRFSDAQSRMPKRSPGDWTRADLSWFSPDMQRRVAGVFELGYRIPQELVGTDCLKRRMSKH